jgi:2-polyprenyl-3-methyl-5-hydroxy-6-metoxy-1,4-benzoquinol methylase
MDWNPITHYQNESVAEAYERERFASLAGRIFNALEKRHIRKAFKSVPRDCVVLDLPCGTGRFAEVLLGQGYTVVGADISAAMLTVARRRLGRFAARFHAKVADVHELAQQEPKKYDVALCARVLMHFPLAQQIAFLKSVADLTKGQVVFTQSYDSFYQRMRRKLKRLLGHRPSSAYPISEAQLQALLRGAGLREVRRQRPMPLMTEEIVVIAEQL